MVKPLSTDTTAPLWGLPWVLPIHVERPHHSVVGSLAAPAGFLHAAAAGGAAVTVPSGDWFWIEPVLGLM